MMSSIGSISLSGMAAAQARLDASANNIANAQTPDFRRQTVETSARPGGGVVTRNGGQAAAPGQDLASDLVNEHQSLFDFKANLRVFQTADAMLGSLLDLHA